MAGLQKDGEIETILVAGEETFEAYDAVPFDTEVIIKYHTFPAEDGENEIIENVEGTEELSTTEIYPPYNTDSAQGLNYLDVVEAFRNAGFTNIITVERYETAFWGHEANTVANIYINNISTHTDWTYEPNAEVRIDYYVISDSSSKSDTELTRFYAQKAFEEYGEAEYPFGFECHWILDLRNAEQYTDGSWYFKVGVTITNTYGAEYDTVAEGTVNGTDIYPVVTQFYVSD